MAVLSGVLGVCGMIKYAIILALSANLTAAYFKISELEAFIADVLVEQENTERMCKITQDGVTHIFKCEIVNSTIAKADF